MSPLVVLEMRLVAQAPFITLMAADMFVPVCLLGGIRHGKPSVEGSKCAV